MDGKTLLTDLYETLNEDESTSSWINEYHSYRCLYKAAIALNSRINHLTTSQAITTVAETQGYTLNADYQKLYLKNRGNQYYIKYYDASAYYFPIWRDYEDLIWYNNTTSASIPDYFTIIDDSTADTRISSTATSAGDATGGQCNLTDSTAPFADVSAGDYVHNTTDGSDGIVLSKTSTAVLVTALFGGTGNDWDSSDAYVIQPQPRYKLFFDPPPSTADHTATVYYVKKPDPVFSDYGIYRFPYAYKDCLIEYAANSYKYRDREPNFGDAFYKYWDEKVRKIAFYENEAKRRKGWHVNFRKRA